MSKINHTKKNDVMFDIRGRKIKLGKKLKNITDYTVCKETVRDKAGKIISQRVFLD